MTKTKMDGKRCTKCHKKKPFEDFSLARQRKDGRQNMCRDCMSAYQRDYKNREHAEPKAEVIYRQVLDDQLRLGATFERAKLAAREAVKAHADAHL